MLNFAAQLKEASMRKIFEYYAWNADAAAALLRIGFGGFMFYHGFVKFINFNETWLYFPDPIGLGKQFSLSLVIFAEFLCGLMVAVGLLTRLSILPIGVTMFVAFFFIHAADPFETKELSLVFLLLSVVVFFFGSGKYSVDNIISSKHYNN
jgi:putative oxidoreductase